MEKESFWNIIISPKMHWICDDRSKIISNWPASYGVKDFNIYAKVFERELFVGLLKENNAASNIIWYQNQKNWSQFLYCSSYYVSIESNFQSVKAAIVYISESH